MRPARRAGLGLLDSRVEALKALALWPVVLGSAPFPFQPPWAGYISRVGRSHLSSS